MRAFDHSVEIAGLTYILRYSFKARREYERKHKGKSVAAIFQRLADTATQTADDIVDVMMVLLSSNHSDVDEDQVVQMIDAMGGEDAVIRLLVSVIDPSQAEDKDSKNA